jgi:hypothetical protein
MAYEISSASGHYDLLTKIRTFVESTIPEAERYTVERNVDYNDSIGTISSITKSGTTATVTLTSPHTLSTNDRVTISGASDSLYNGVFKITYSDAYKFLYTMSGTPSTDASGTLVGTRNDAEVIWKAPGLSGLEEIYFGIKTYQSTSADFYNFKIGQFTGYVPSNSFEAQPGNIPIMGVPLWNQTIPYWLVANGQRLILFAKVENVYESFYLGKFLPYATPTQFPYPVFCGGSFSTATETRYSDTNHVAWFMGSRANCLLRHVDGVGKQVDLYPYAGIHQLRNTASASLSATGYYGLHSIVMSDSTPNVYGELDGVYYISGFNNAAENTVIHDGITYVVMRNIWRTGFNDYIALRLQ